MPLAIPISNATFRRSFLGGAGNLELATDNDIWRTLFETRGRFDDRIDKVADVRVSAGSDFEFGREGRLKLKLSTGGSALHQIQVYWPGADAEELRRYGLRELLTADRLCMRLLFSAQGSAALEGGSPLGPLTGTFGVSLGGDVGFERLKFYRNDQTVPEILGDLFGSLRLPQDADQVQEIPEPGEVLIAHYGGYLKLNAGLTWGYSLAGSKSVEAGALRLDLDYALRLMAAVSVGYQLAGEFALEARAGFKPDWIRLVVRKSRQSRFTFAADFGLDANFALNGLPEDADEFLTKLIGADAETILGYFDQARRYADVDELEKEVGRLAKGFVHDYARELLGTALTKANLDQFLSRMNAIANSYVNLDRRILDLIRDITGKAPTWANVLSLLAEAVTRADLQKLLNANSQALELTRRLWNERVFDLLLKDEEFAQFAALVGKAQALVSGQAGEEIRQVIARVNAAFPLRGLIDQLAQVRTTADLVNLADEKLQGFVERIIGQSFEKIRGGDAKRALDEIKKTLEAVDDFKDRWYDKLTKAAKQSFSAKLNLAYSRATANQALLDVEINLANDEGRKLYAEAAKGDLSEALRRYDAGLVRINEGILTRQVAEAFQFQFNVLGYEHLSLAKLVQDTEHAIEEKDGGVLHVFTTETALEQRRSRGRDKAKETVASNFLLRTVAESFRPAGQGTALDPKTRDYVLNTLRSMAVRYDLTHEDEVTDPEELTAYLSLADSLGLIPSRTALTRELQREFPNGLGKVTVSYTVRYDDQAVRNAFTLTRDEIEDKARDTMRKLIAAELTGTTSRSDIVLIGFAYLAGFRPPMNASTLTIHLPDWYRGSLVREVALGRPGIAVLGTMFRVEDSYLKALTGLDDLIDRLTRDRQAVPVDKLNQAARHFVEMADDVDQWFRANAFFAVFDRLVRDGSGGKGLRDSAMVLEITPPGGSTVTKVLSAGPSAAEMQEAGGMPQESLPARQTSA